jgi:MFS family permease
MQSTIVFVRDRFTWLAYFMLAYYAYMQAAQSQSMLFLSEELGLSYTVRSYHLSAFALGMILAGLNGDRVGQRFGSRITFCGGGLGMALGAALLIYGQQALITIASSFIMGLIGSYMLVMVNATLSDKHGQQRAIALTEANILASISAGLAPLLVGGFQSLGAGWRLALIAGIASWLLMLLYFRPSPFPQSGRVISGDPASSSLPVAFWAYVLLVLVNVAIEWSVIFWGAEFLETAIGFSGETATALMTAFFVAMVIGRTVGSRLARQFHSGRLLLLAIAIVIVGFPLFWLPRLAPLNIVGLFIAGLGIANLFPLTLATATNAVPSHANKASARVSMASGIAILIAPQVLGSLGDQIGIERAYGIVIIMMIVAMTVTLLAGRLATRDRLTVELEEGTPAI